jgi:sterol desaturase/sphingolipid hydroxylase (fatty acid hydroxylase superfamily)
VSFGEAVSELKNDNLVWYALPLFVVAILIEYGLSIHFHRNLYQGRDFWTSIAIGLVTLVVEFIPKVLAFIVYWHVHQISPLRDVIGRQWWAWGMLFFLDDFTYYWFHRMNHEVRILWAGHVAHHSSVFLNFGTALRQGVGERLHKFFFWLWLPALGFDPLMIFVIISISLIYQFWVHTELIDKFPKPIEAVFNTPSHHRVHHASNVQYLDCNHAGVLIIWDKLFGTFSPEQIDAKPVYGLTTNIQTYNVAKVATHEYGSIWHDFKRATKWSDKLRYLFLAPGWSHDGEDKRAKEMRKRLSKESGRSWSSSQ